ncbi:MAG: phosphoglycerate dehydrogenase [Candidatus Schekmanbacteria bacterium]|nr:phosphoglycerate dehydrogenase [Candidatus Schekmanbacteria bacterium]
MFSLSKILVSDSLSKEGLAILAEHPQLNVDIKTKMTPQELIDCVGDYEALIVRSGTKVTAPVIDAAKKLKVIGRAGTGIDNVDLEAATKRGIIVMNTPGGNTLSTAEHTLAMILALSRQIPQANASIKAGLWEKKKFMGVELFGKTLGIVGLGRIGAELARRAQKFGMRVLTYDPYINMEATRRLGVEVREFNQLLPEADFVTLHLPLTARTKYIIDSKAIQLMKKGARLINCARGGLVDEKALTEALQSGHLAGAALDVFEQEPAPADHPLLKFPQVVVTPHLGASTKEAQEKVAVDIAIQIKDYLISGAISNALNMPSLPAGSSRILKPYMVLAEKMSSLIAQLCSGRFEEFQLQYSGEILECPLSPLTVAALTGLLRPILGEDVNYVNAPLLAKDRNIKVMESKRSEQGDYASSICLKIKTDSEQHSITGTIFGRQSARVVELDGFALEAIPEGYLLVLSNQDTPGVVGKIGKALGGLGINIGGMQLSRDEKGGRALSLLNVDSPLPAFELEFLCRVPEILAVKQVRI